MQINTVGSTLNYGAPAELFEVGYIDLNHGGGSFHPYEVSPDGQRFLIPRAVFGGAGDAGATPITVIFNWTASLKR